MIDHVDHAERLARLREGPSAAGRLVAFGTLAVLIWAMPDLAAWISGALHAVAACR